MKEKEFKTAGIRCGPQKGPSASWEERMAGPNRSQELPGDKDREQPTSWGQSPCGGVGLDHFWGRSQEDKQFRVCGLCGSGTATLLCL